MGHSRYAPRQREQDQLHSPVMRYLQHGNSLPSRAQLESSVPRLLVSHITSTVLVAADMCIDLAMADASDAPRHLGIAGDALNGILDQIATLRDQGYNQATKLRHHGLQARFRLEELENWRRAAAGETIVSNYDALLQAALSAEPLNVTDLSFTKMVELMPILLGVRAKQHTRTSGWLGRLSLLREERKGILVSGTNPNWDVGILTAPTPADYFHPPKKLQIKAGKGKKSAQSINAGVIPITGRHYRFNNPAQIIYSCIGEIDSAQVPSGLPFNVLTSDELDVITQKLHDRILTEV